MEYERNIKYAEATRHGFGSWLLCFIKENPFKFFSAVVWSAGFVLLLVFFGRIRYMPDMTLSDIASVLYAMASLGLFISFYVMFLLAIPGAALSLLKNNLWNVNKAHLFILPFTSSLVLVLALGYYLNLWFSRNLLCLLALVGAVILILPMFGAFSSCNWPDFEFVGSVKDKSLRRGNFKRYYIFSLLEVMALIVIMAFPLFFVILMGTNGDIRTAPDYMVLIVLFLILLAVSVVATLISSVKPGGALYLSCLVVPLLFFYVMSATGSFSVIPFMVVRVLNLGEISAARIVVDKKTCDEMNGALGQKVCSPTAGADVASICPVIIRSRIGSQVVLDFAALAVERKSLETDDHVGLESKHESALVWVTTRGAIDGKSGHGVARRVILEKGKILAWQPLPAILERDEQDRSLQESSAPLVGAAIFLKEALGKENKNNNEESILNRNFPNECELVRDDAVHSSKLPVLNNP